MIVLVLSLLFSVIAGEEAHAFRECDCGADAPFLLFVNPFYYDIGICPVWCELEKFRIASEAYLPRLFETATNADR